MSVYGYCRISTPKQSIDRQVRNILLKYPSAHILKEIYTGTKIEGRKEWNKLYNNLQCGDTVVFDSVSRMSRNASDGFSLYQELFQKGIDLVFLKEPHINTVTYKKALSNNICMTGTKTDIILKAVNEYLMELAKQQILVAFEQSEKEVEDLRQRTKEGMMTAKINGKRIGRQINTKIEVKKKKPIMEIIKDKSKDFDGYNTDREVMAILDNLHISVKDRRGQIIKRSAHLSKNTYYKYKKELSEKIRTHREEEWLWIYFM